MEPSAISNVWLIPAYASSPVKTGACAKTGGTEKRHAFRATWQCPLCINKNSIRQQPHRYTQQYGLIAYPVGAGAPAKRPSRATAHSPRVLTPGRRNDREPLSPRRFSANSDSSVVRAGQFPNTPILQHLISSSEIPHKITTVPVGAGSPARGPTVYHPPPKSLKSYVARCPPALRPSGVAPESTMD